MLEELTRHLYYVFQEKSRYSFCDLQILNQYSCIASLNHDGGNCSFILNTSADYCVIAKVGGLKCLTVH